MSFMYVPMYLCIGTVFLVCMLLLLCMSVSHSVTVIVCMSVSQCHYVSVSQCQHIFYDQNVQVSGSLCIGDRVCLGAK